MPHPHEFTAHYSSYVYGKFNSVASMANADGTNFDAGTSVLWENCLKKHAALAIEATELNLDFFRIRM